VIALCAESYDGSARAVATSVKTRGHGARSRNQQRKVIDLKLGFKIEAEQVQPMILRLASEIFALGRAFVSGAGLPERRKRRIPRKRQRAHQDANDRANHPT
jgi:hypothetical protein